MNRFHTLADASYVSIESYRNNGEAVRTPVWITAEGDKLTCWTLANSGKVKRIRANPQVKLAKCSAGGQIEGNWLAAEGRVLDSEAAVKNQARRMSKKYGLKFLPFRLIEKLRGRKAVVIEFSPAEPS